MVSPSTTRAVEFLEKYLTGIRCPLDELKETAHAEGVPWSAVESASRRLGVIKTFEWWSGRNQHVWKLVTS